MLTTLLSFTSLALGLAVAAVGVRLLARRLPRPSAGLVCGHCGAPAATLAGFTCPDCARDVRSTGIVAPSRSRPGRRDHTRFFVCVWTVLILVLAAVVTLAVQATAPGEYLHRAELEQRWSQPAGVRQMRMTAVGWGARHDDWTAHRAAVELFDADGRMAELELRGAPLRATARDATGRKVFAERPLDATAIREWLAAALPHPAGDELSQLSSAVYGSIADQLPGEPGLGRAWPGRSFHPGLAGSSASTFNVRAPRPRIVAAEVIGWPLIWLAGLAWLLPKPAGRRPPAPVRGSHA